MTEILVATQRPGWSRWLHRAIYLLVFILGRWLFLVAFAIPNIFIWYWPGIRITEERLSDGSAALLLSTMSLALAAIAAIVLGAGLLVGQVASRVSNRLVSEQLTPVLISYLALLCAAAIGSLLTILNPTQTSVKICLAFGSTALALLLPFLVWVRSRLSTRTRIKRLGTAVLNRTFAVTEDNYWNVVTYCGPRIDLLESIMITAIGTQDYDAFADVAQTLGNIAGASVQAGVDGEDSSKTAHLIAITAGNALAVGLESLDNNQRMADAGAKAAASMMLVPSDNAVRALMVFLPCQRAVFRSLERGEVATAIAMSLAISQMHEDTSTEIRYGVIRFLQAVADLSFEFELFASWEAAVSGAGRVGRAGVTTDPELCQLVGLWLVIRSDAWFPFIGADQEAVRSRLFLNKPPTSDAELEAEAGAQYFDTQFDSSHRSFEQFQILSSTYSSQTWGVEGLEDARTHTLKEAKSMGLALHRVNADSQGLIERVDEMQTRHDQLRQAEKELAETTAAAKRYFQSQHPRLMGWVLVARELIRTGAS